MGELFVALSNDGTIMHLVDLSAKLFERIISLTVRGTHHFSSKEGGDDAVAHCLLRPQRSIVFVYYSSVNNANKQKTPSFKNDQLLREFLFK